MHALHLGRMTVLGLRWLKLDVRMEIRRQHLAQARKAADDVLLTRNLLAGQAVLAQEKQMI